MDYKTIIVLLVYYNAWLSYYHRLVINSFQFIQTVLILAYHQTIL